MFRRQALQFWLGIGASLVFSYLALQGVNWGDFGRSLQTITLPWVLLSALTVVVGFAVMALRWQVLLTSAGRFSLPDCLAFLMIGQLANFVLPLRAGELIRPALMGQRTGASKSAILATVVVERLFDLVSLAVLVVAVTLSMEMPAVVRDAALAAEAVAVAVLGGLWLAARRQLGGRIVSLAAGMVPERWRTPMVGLAESFLGGLGALRTGRQVWLVMAYSLLSWGLAVLGVELMLRAFGLSLPWYAAVFVVVVSNLGMMIPSSPGFIGVAHFLYVFALSAFGVDKSVALSFAIVQHGVSYVLTVGLGLLFLWLEGIVLSQVRAAGRASAIQ